MIDASLYQSVYFIVVTLATFFSFKFYDRWGRLLNSNSGRTAFLSSIALLTFVAIFIGTRPVSRLYFGDMIVYNQYYTNAFNTSFFFSWDTENLIWDNFLEWMACRGVPFATWLIIIAFIYFGLIFWACYKMFNKDVLLAFVVYLGALSTFSYGTNGMKAGVAASLFIVGIAYRERLLLSVPLVLLSYGLHHSMVMVIAAYFVVLLIKNPKYFFWGWLVCVALAAMHVTYFQTLFANYTDKQGAEYLIPNSIDSYLTGFRPDFILYSAVPVFLGYLCLYKYKYKSNMYNFLLNLYLFTNSIWMLCMYASFTNRIAYLSWLMYPIVLLYPFISKNEMMFQGKYLGWVVYGHLGFTLFMLFIYD